MDPQKLDDALIAFAIILLAFAFVFGGGSPSLDPSSGCSVAWHPLVYCTPGQNGAPALTDDP
jgi:hypothetical protein